MSPLEIVCSGLCSLVQVTVVIIHYSVNYSTRGITLSYSSRIVEVPQEGVLGVWVSLQVY